MLPTTRDWSTVHLAEPEVPLPVAITLPPSIKPVSDCSSDWSGPSASMPSAALTSLNRVLAFPLSVHVLWSTLRMWLKPWNCAPIEERSNVEFSKPAKDNMASVPRLTPPTNWYPLRSCSRLFEPLIEIAAARVSSEPTPPDTLPATPMNDCDAEPSIPIPPTAPSPPWMLAPVPTSTRRSLAAFIQTPWPPFPGRPRLPLLVDIVPL